MGTQGGKHWIRLHVSGAPGGVFIQFLFLMSRTPYHGVVTDLYLDAPHVGESNMFWERTQTKNTKIPVSPSDNPLDWVIDQYKDDSYELTDIMVGDAISFIIQESHCFPLWKKYSKLIKFKPFVASEVDRFATENISGNTLGVHVRTSDMNTGHPWHGIFTVNDYIREIDEYLSNNEVDNIFIASDNKKSIEDISKRFNNVVYYNCTLREDSDEGWSGRGALNQSRLNDPLLWEESFIECLLLSKCSALIKRISSMSDVAIIFSDTIKNVTVLGKSKNVRL